VATWPLAQQVNETISVSANGLDVGSMGAAARAGYGALLLFGTTAARHFSAIVATLQRERPNHSTMLIMTDQEGGGVQRLSNIVASLPWAQTMGRNLSAAQIMGVGKRVGRSMSAAGVNTDLAPVLDVDARAQYPGATNPDGFRSFSGVASVAARDGVAFFRGLRQGGVLSVVKHFPGLGHATGNTDYGPAATLPWSKLQRSGLIPFEDAINDGVSGVMVSNATVPGLTSMPASISPNVMNILRQRMDFNGLIVTDSLSAGALSALGLGVPGASVRALEAGVDLVLAGSPASSSASLTLAAETSNAIQTALKTGALSASTIESAAAHVLASESQLACPS
jgi:beta-N-acetylhexosaminidase